MLEALDDITQSRFVFFSQLVNKPVRSADGQDVGRLVDLVVIPGDAYPPVEALILRSWHSSRLRLLWTAVAGYDEHHIQLLPSAVAEPVADIIPPNRMRLADEILDRQIVDVEGAKLERVNDIHFLEVKGLLRLAHVDVSFRGLVRRMGWEKALDSAVRGVAPRSSYLTPSGLLGWKHIHPLGEASGHMRVDLAQAQLSELHPADLAEIIEELDREQRTTLFSRLDTETAAEALEEVSPEVSTQLLNDVSPDVAAEILEEMAPEEAADVLAELPTETQSDLLEAMDQPEAREVVELLQYDRRSAGGMMTPLVLRFLDTFTAAEGLAEIKRRAEEIFRIYEVFVIDAAGILRGHATLKDLLVAPLEAPLRDLMREVPGSVAVDAPLHEVADLAAKYRLLAVPVVEPSGELLGIVTIDDILPAVLDGA